MRIIIIYNDGKKRGASDVISLSVRHILQGCGEDKKIKSIALLRASFRANYLLI